MVPVAVSASRGWRLKSWDRFLIPKPFARVHIVYGDLMSIEPGDVRDAADEADRASRALAQTEQRAND
jgi:lysophospholipid acyltransferase (LPLAT)-like uncharacterized protein